MLFSKKTNKQNKKNSATEFCVQDSNSNSYIEEKFYAQDKLPSPREFLRSVNVCHLIKKVSHKMLSEELA